MQDQGKKNNGNGKANGQSKGSNGKAHDQGEKRRPADDFIVGRILVKIWPQNTGPLFRFNAEFRYYYGDGSLSSIPVRALPDLRVATYKAAKRIKQLERLQHVPGWLRLVKIALGA